MQMFFRARLEASTNADFTTFKHPSDPALAKGSRASNSAMTSYKIWKDINLDVSYSHNNNKYKWSKSTPASFFTRVSTHQAHQNSLTFPWLFWFWIFPLTEPQNFSFSVTGKSCQFLGCAAATAAWWSHVRVGVIVIEEPPCAGGDWYGERVLDIGAGYSGPSQLGGLTQELGSLTYGGGGAPWANNRTGTAQPLRWDSMHGLFSCWWEP